jgi:hypothetical protein
VKEECLNLVKIRAKAQYGITKLGRIGGEVEKIILTVIFF